jgi:branched-chain polyamine synthase A-like protein
VSVDADGFRGLLGIAPDGKLALLESLLAGDSSLEGLVGASALPRRDVEEFTAALGLGDPASDADRDACRKLLSEYRASRARVRPQDEAAAERAAAELIAGVPAPRKRFDHVQATPGTLVRRVAWLTSRFDLSGRSVLFVGDHDLTSLLLARVVPDAQLSVADIDEDLLAYIDARGGGRVRCAWADFRCGLPPAFEQAADVVFTDPPYTPEGLGLFLSRSVSALSGRDPGGRIVVAYGHSRRRPDLGLAAQREIARQDLVIDAMLPGFSRYAGAQAVGSASDLYCLQPAPAAFRRGGAARLAGIYTHGEQSVESGAANAADLIPLLARITLSGTADPAAVGVVAADPGTARGFVLSVSLAKLLADGVHPSVTGRAGEIVADLRDDPGPWLLRVMLALNAQRAVFVVPRRHEALQRLMEGAPEWNLLRAKFASVSPAPVGDLVAVRCVLAPDPSGTRASGSDPGMTGGAPDAPADPGLALTRFVARRAHGRLRNVWREGLVEASGGALTKRQAADLAAEHAGDRSADLALRLIDVPAAHLRDLSAALRASAEAV